MYRILFQHADFLVIDKQPGIGMHDEKGEEGGETEPGLVNRVKADTGLTLYPVHRLDKPTTGCCAVAKTAFGQQALSEAFRRHLTDKRYVAVVCGAPLWEKLDVDARLARIDDPDLPKERAGKKGVIGLIAQSTNWLV